MSSNTEELQEQVAKLMTGGVHYHELRDNFTNSGSMQPEFPARWAGDVADEVDEIVKLIQQHDSTLKAEYEEKVREARITELEALDAQREEVEYTSQLFGTQEKKYEVPINLIRNRIAELKRLRVPKEDAI